MQDILPKENLAPTRINPKILVLYGKPKVGKTGIVSVLKSALNLDCEGGAEMYNSKRLPVRSIDGALAVDKDGKIVSIGLTKVYELIVQYGMDLAKAGKPVEFPYKFLILDTLDKLEDFCEISGTAKYKASTIGKTFTGNSVLELPKGAGYYHLRNEVMAQIELLATVCKYLILITHIKEVNLDKGGIEVTTQDISLTGKLAQMVCAKADVIGYLYREKNIKKEDHLMVSFETSEGAVMGSRFPRLAGRRFKFDWNQIYINEPDLVDEEALLALESGK